MIRLLVIFVVLLVVWQLFRVLSKPATLEQARTIGLEEARENIQNPILLEDYLKERNISLDILESLIERGDMPIYQWRQYTFIENRELIDINK